VPDARSPYQYAIIRVVPRVERGEFVNAGIVLLCRSRAYIGAAVELREERLRAVAPDADVALIRTHLSAVERIAAGDPGAGPIAALSIAERFHWLVAPASTVIQASPVHAGLTEDPVAELERLLDAFVRQPAIQPVVPPGVSPADLD
jgi:hypothetical protein